MREFHSEVSHLALFKKNYQVSIHYTKGNLSIGKSLKSYYPKVKFSILGETFETYVKDEFNDHIIGREMLTLYLMLRTIEEFKDYYPNYDFWSMTNYFTPDHPKARGYYKSLKKIYLFFIDKNIPIDSFIGDYDFEMNHGPAKELREADFIPEF